jgi:hypothetical protein
MRSMYPSSHWSASARIIMHGMATLVGAPLAARLVDAGTEGAPSIGRGVGNSGAGACPFNVHLPTTSEWSPPPRPSGPLVLTLEGEAVWATAAQRPHVCAACFHLDWVPPCCTPDGAHAYGGLCRVYVFAHGGGRLTYRVTHGPALYMYMIQTSGCGVLLGQEWLSSARTTSTACATPREGPLLRHASWHACIRGPLSSAVLCHRCGRSSLYRPPAGPIRRDRTAPLTAHTRT